MRDDAAQYITALVQYPNDAHSRERYKDHLVAYRNDHLKAGADYAVSAFDTSIARHLATGIGERAAAGLVTLYLFRLAIDDDSSHTKYKASKFASRYVEMVKSEKGHKPLEVPWRDGASESSLKLPFRSSSTNLTTSFDRYSSIGSITAAMLTIGNHEKETYDISEIKRRTARTLRIALEIEKVVHVRYPEYFPDAWTFIETAPTEVLNAPEPAFDADFRKALPID